MTKKTHRYQNYLIPAYVFWGLDRVLRLARIIWNNRGIHPSPIKAEVISSDMIKLSIYQRMSWKAGQSAYITIPTISWLPFESHPFTIATIPTTETDVPSELVFLVKVRNGFTKRLYQAISIAQERNNELQLNAFIDGPYGSPSHLAAFSDVIIITGLSCVPFSRTIFLLTLMGRWFWHFLWIASVAQHCEVSYVRNACYMCLPSYP